jgi:hypothetical protein
MTVPAQHRLGAHQQPGPAEYVAGQPVQQGSERRPVRRGEPDLLAVQLPFEDHDLVPERQDLGVFAPIAHRQAPEQREGIGHAEVRESTSTPWHHRPVIAAEPARSATSTSARSCFRSRHP